MSRKKNRSRCAWASKEIFHDYHDHEWGVPVHDDRLHFEFLVLEGAQAGLSWETILKKREGYRQAFDNFDPSKVARYSEAKITKLLANPAIIRNRLKVRSAVSNARAFLAVQADFDGFDSYIWGFVGGQPIQTNRRAMSEIPAVSEQSDALSIDLKKRGFKFVGSTIIYAHMQAIGMVNDHAMDCFRYQECKALGN